MCGLAPSRVLSSLRYTAGGWESATVRVLPTGKVEVLTGSTPHGQGHVTCWSQIVADRLGVDPDDVEVLHSDTAISPLGMDTYGSRSLAVGGVARASPTDSSRMNASSGSSSASPAVGVPRCSRSWVAARRVKALVRSASRSRSAMTEPAAPIPLSEPA